MSAAEPDPSAGDSLPRLATAPARRDAGRGARCCRGGPRAGGATSSAVRRCVRRATQSGRGEPIRAPRRARGVRVGPQGRRGSAADPAVIDVSPDRAAPRHPDRGRPRCRRCTATQRASILRPQSSASLGKESGSFFSSSNSLRGHGMVASSGSLTRDHQDIPQVDRHAFQVDSHLRAAGVIGGVGENRVRLFRPARCQFPFWCGLQ